MIGGNGGDKLDGGDGDDLLIGGRTTFDQNLPALDAILAEWAGAASYDNRIDHLIGALAGGLNGATLLIKNVTVLDDGVADALIGGLGLDAFFIFSCDSIDKTSKERQALSRRSRIEASLPGGGIVAAPRPRRVVGGSRDTAPAGDGRTDTSELGRPITRAWSSCRGRPIASPDPERPRPRPAIVSLRPTR